MTRKLSITLKHDKDIKNHCRLPVLTSKNFPHQNCLELYYTLIYYEKLLKIQATDIYHNNNKIKVTSVNDISELK